MFLETSLIDSDIPNLDWSRQNVVEKFCDAKQESNWESILAESPSEFQEDFTKYASENLVKMHMFIAEPFSSEYYRYIQTSRISFIANVGGRIEEKLTKVCELQRGFIL